jgi:hypothetical protein
MTASAGTAAMTPNRLNGMEPTAAGELVTITTGGAPIDGIGFDTPSATKVRRRDH